MYINQSIEIIQSGEQKEKTMKRNKASENLCDTIRCGNIHIMVVPEGGQNERKRQKEYVKN